MAYVERVDPDEAVGGYFRNGGHAATLNPNARSRCVGCAFCPNTLEAAADPRLNEEKELEDLLAALVEQHPRHDLSQLREVTVSTGCFEREVAAVSHLKLLRKVLNLYNVDARIGLLTSVITSPAAFDEVAAYVNPFVLRLTVECFTRRDLMLKASKATLSPKHIRDILIGAKRAGLDTSYTYIVGLDPLDDLKRGVAALAEHVTEFPNFQIFQAHNALMEGLRAPGAESLVYYLQARSIIEDIVEPTGLRPAPWECYRPLWLTAFAGHSLAAAA